MAKPLLKLVANGYTTNDDVLTLQRLIVWFGSKGKSVSCDRVFGPNTEAALKKAQKHFGLPETGESDEATWNALYEWLQQQRTKFDTFIESYKCDHTNATSVEKQNCDDLWTNHVSGKCKRADGTFAGGESTCTGFGSTLSECVETKKGEWTYVSKQTSWAENDGIDVQLALMALGLMELYQVNALNVHSGYRCNWTYFRIRKVYNGGFGNHAGCGLDFHIDGTEVKRPNGSTLTQYSATTKTTHSNEIRDDLQDIGVIETTSGTSPIGPRTEARADSSTWVHLDTTILPRHKFIKTFDELLTALGADASATGTIPTSQPNGGETQQSTTPPPPTEQSAPTKPDKNPEFAKTYSKLEKEGKGGFYPVGANLCWHGGVHLPAAENDPIYAAMPGTIVAARLSDKPETGEGPHGNRNFILIEHKIRQKTVYSLYMHLAVHSVEESDEWVKKSSWMKAANQKRYRLGEGRNLRKTKGSTSKADVIVTVPADQLILKIADTDSPDWKKVQTSSGGTGFMNINSDKITEENFVLADELKTGKVVKLSVPVQSGDFLWGAGKLGPDESGIHFEIFSEENILAAESRLTAFAKPGALRNPESSPKGWKTGEALRVVAVHQGPKLAAAGEELPLEVWKLNFGDAPASKQCEISWQILTQPDGGPETELEILEKKGPKTTYTIPENAQGKTLFARPFMNEAKIGLEVKVQIVESLWHECSDPNSDLNVDSAEISGILGGLLADGALTKEELTDFFKKNPDNKADILRGYICRFPSEWGVPDVRTAVDNLQAAGWEIGEADLLPYQWWSEAAIAGVALPNNRNVWHYHPIRFIEMLPYIQASTSKPGLKVLKIDAPKGAKKGVWVELEASQFADSVETTEMARVQWSWKAAGKDHPIEIKGKKIRIKFSDSEIGEKVEISAWIDKVEDGCRASIFVGPCLLFDGQKLAWINENGEEEKKWAGVSGLPGKQTAEYQSEAFAGPIPQGKWAVKQSQLQHIDSQKWYQNHWPGGEDRWGKHRVWLEPLPSTNTLGRSNFCIHGGKEAGSAGCIDLTDKMDDFASFFSSQSNDLTLIVRYAGSQTETKDLRNLSKDEFVKSVHASAKKDELTSGVPAAVTTAQACLETGYGKSVPTDIETGKYSYNLFGIKGTGTAGSVKVWTHEVINGERIKIKDDFQAYNSFEESISGRSGFFKKNKRYHHLFDSKDPDEWAEGLQKAGYATDPEYASKLISIMNKWSLK